MADETANQGSGTATTDSNPHNTANSTKTVSLEGLQRYHHEVCGALGLEQDTLKYDYTYTSTNPKHESETFTAPDTLKGAVDDLYGKTMLMCDSAKKFFDAQYHSKFDETRGSSSLSLSVSPANVSMFESGDSTVTITATFTPGSDTLKYVDENGIEHASEPKSNVFVNQGTTEAPVYVTDFAGSVTAPSAATLQWTRTTNTSTKVVYTASYTFNALDSKKTTTTETGTTVTYEDIAPKLPEFAASGSVKQTHWTSSADPQQDGTNSSHNLSKTASVGLTTSGTWAFQHFDSKPTANFFNENYKDKFASIGKDVQTITTSVKELKGGKYGVKYIYIISKSSNLSVKTTAGVPQIVAEGSISTVAGTYYIYHSKNEQSGNLNGLVITGVQ